MPIFNAHAVNNCTGATYYDADSDTCIACPSGYDYNTDAGKTSVSQCQIQCAAGTWNGYTQLEYIESDGNSYIDTNYIASQNTEVVAVALRTLAKAGFLYGSRYSDNTKWFTAYLDVVGYWRVGSGSSGINANSYYPANTMHETIQNKSGVWIDGVKRGTYSTVSNFKTLGSLYVFFANGSSGKPSEGLRIYSFVINEDGRQIMSLVPVRRNSDNEIGLYDTVTKQFFTNSGTGSFVAGSDVAGFCTDVGIGYYAGASTTNYGSTGTRTACPAGTTTSITNADSVSDCEPCGDDEIFEYVNGIASCIPAKFTVTTTDLDINSNTQFKFNISARGTFYVDCGADGTLSGTGAVDNTITRGNVTNALYKCTYTTGGVKTVKFAGIATAYSTSATTAAISFYTNATPGLVDGISGSLGAIFPSLGSANGSQPRFYQTFRGCAKITSVPSELFTGISGVPATYMFYQTFYNCSKLTGSIPTGLFGSLSGAPATSMFSETFRDCSGLTGAIPSGLFGNLSGAPATQMFNATFYNCSGLSGLIPSGLFGNLSGAPATQMFRHTFYGCSGLTGSIPSGLFGNLSGAPAASMFEFTFSGCSKLTGSIPSGLFGNISGAPKSKMFNGTFYGCSRLTGSIPSGLFGNLSGAAADSMFYQTFSGCSGLSGAIPSGLFGNISGAPATSMFFETFRNCSNLSGPIPSGLFGNLSGAPATYMFQDTFNGCSSLTGSIPSGLFGNLSGGSVNAMFMRTFNNCRGLSGYIPKDLFENITSNSASNCFSNTFASTNLYTTCPCGTKPATTGWGDTKVNTRAVCEVGTKTNEHWDNGTCTTDCTLGVTRFKSSTGLDYPLLSDPTGVHNIYFGYNNGVCHVPLVSGAANNAINVSFNGETYHASQPDEIMPTGFTGQPAAE